MKTIILAVFVFLAGVLMWTARPALAFDFFGTGSSSACNSQSKDSPVCQPSTETENPVVKAIRLTASVLAAIAGFLAVMMIIISGFQFVTSGGSDEAVANARKRITNSLVGLAIVALAWTIVRFVTDRIT